MSHWKVVLPAVILLGGFLVCSTASYGTVDIAKATKKNCLFCHEKNVPADKEAMKKNLNDAGKYYQKNKSLDGYVQK